jgi:hypothetical protein
MKKILIAAMIAFFVFGTTCAFAQYTTDPDKKDSKEDDAKKAPKGKKGEKRWFELLFFTVTPTTMTYEGGQITVSVTVSDNVDVQTVIAILIKPNGQQSPVHMTRVSGTPKDGEWRTSWIMPMNTGSNPLVYGVKVRASDTSKGFNSVESDPVTVTVAGKPKSDFKKPIQPMPGKK